MYYRSTGFTLKSSIVALDWTNPVSMSQHPHRFFFSPQSVTSFEVYCKSITILLPSLYLFGNLKINFSSFLITSINYVTYGTAYLSNGNFSNVKEAEPWYQQRVSHLLRYYTDWFWILSRKYKCERVKIVFACCSPKHLWWQDAESCSLLLKFR